MTSTKGGHEHVSLPGIEIGPPSHASSAQSHEAPSSLPPLPGAQQPADADPNILLTLENLRDEMRQWCMSVGDAVTILPDDRTKKYSGSDSAPDSEKDNVDDKELNVWTSDDEMKVWAKWRQDLQRRPEPERNRVREPSDVINIVHPSEYDVMFFAETDMPPGEDEVVDVPTGSRWFLSPENHSRRGGGVALFATHLLLSRRNSAHRILVLDMGPILLRGRQIAK
ncbi:hypothetical protein B0H14DRAFT_2568089 [Mycena olivaceomarginata]|nr:hypothetical protein B0H14DRAFT_2568089 [Mycena olivaceomarginata]